MAKATNEQSQNLDPRCTSPNGGGEDSQLLEYKPQDIAQIDTEYKNKLKSDLARIEKKYLWTDPAHNKDDNLRRQEKDRFKAAHRGDDHRSVKKLEILLLTGINEESRDFKKAWVREDMSHRNKVQQINGMAAANDDHESRTAAEKAASVQQKQNLTEKYEKRIIALRKQFMTGTFEMDAPTTALNLEDVRNFAEANKLMDANPSSTTFVMLGAPPPKRGVTIVTYVDPKVHAELGWRKELTEAQKQTYLAHQISLPYDSAGTVITSDIQCGAMVNATCRVNGNKIIEIKDGKQVNSIS